ncbi:MAG: pyridoxamine 5'-phosphate oxidase [Acidimicrobiia bacterium]
MTDDFDFSEIRTHYQQSSLDVADVDPNPMRQFAQWFQEALDSGVNEPDAMAVATATPEGVPSVRFVVLRGYDDRGFAFYTNDTSRKAGEIAANPRAAITIYWRELERQVRVVGSVTNVPQEEAERYYRKRPLESRIGAWASPQSEVIADRAALDALVKAAAARLGDDPPKPPFWNGYLVAPDEVEFWQGRAGRLHDRVRYSSSGPGWNLERLAP